jgi:hypothetical protein
MSIQALLLILVFGAIIGGGLAFFYQRGFDACVKQAEKGSIRLSTENLRTIHWLAENGFRRLLLLGLREPHSGFQTREQAENADWALGDLEHYLPKDEMKSDYRWDRMTSIVTRWPTDGPAAQVTLSVTGDPAFTWSRGFICMKQVRLVG